MTDNEIIKALKCHAGIGRHKCDDCPLKVLGVGACSSTMARNAFDLVNRVKFLPCKVGDEVWAIRSYKNTKFPVKGKVSEMYYIDESMKLCIVVKGVTRGEWGKAVFPTYEAAEDYLNKRSARNEGQIE